MLPANASQQQRAAAIGQLVKLNTEGLRVLCKVTDVKSVFGRICVQVQPVAGEGLAWVNTPRVTPVDEPAFFSEAKTQREEVSRG